MVAKANKLVFTAGVMDMLHEGHRNLIKQMRMKAGAHGLIAVILHNDQSTWGNKKRWPVESLERRIHNLICTNRVDIVKHTVEMDPAQMFEYLIHYYLDGEVGKALFMRGDDWDQFPGRDWLVRNKVPIKIIPYTKGVSSTELRREMGETGRRV